MRILRKKKFSTFFTVGAEQSSFNLLRRRRSISESTRFHNEYDRSDHRGHSTKHETLEHISQRHQHKQSLSRGHGQDLQLSRNSMQQYDDTQIQARPPSNRRQRRSLPSNSRQQNSPPENEKRCKHGTTWMNRCNRCRCFGGRAACTRMACDTEVSYYY